MYSDLLKTLTDLRCVNPTTTTNSFSPAFPPQQEMTNEKVGVVVDTDSQVARPICIADLEKHCRKTLDEPIWQYYFHGADDELTRVENAVAFNRFISAAWSLIVQTENSTSSDAKCISN